MQLETLDAEKVYVVHAFLSPDECGRLIARSEGIGYEAAAVGGELVPLLRNNARAFLEDVTLAANLWARLAAVFPTRQGDWEACGLHERFRFYRYDTAEQFGRHHDGCVSRPNGEESKFTFMIYLSEVEEGGETLFFTNSGEPRFGVRPGAGKALVFEHLQLHEGAPVSRGRKYVLRTDVMFQPPAASHE